MVLRFNDILISLHLRPSTYMIAEIVHTNAKDATRAGRRDIPQANRAIVGRAVEKLWICQHLCIVKLPNRRKLTRHCQPITEVRRILVQRGKTNKVLVPATPVTMRPVEATQVHV